MKSEVKAVNKIQGTDGRQFPNQPNVDTGSDRRIRSKAEEKAVVPLAVAASHSFYFQWRRETPVRPLD